VKREGPNIVIRVSVIVPAYNEAATIVPLLREVRAQKVDDVEFEVVVIDDGSNDDTLALLEQNPSLFDILVRQPRNGGKGAAVIAGLKQASGQYILFQDADLEYSPSHYDLMLMPVKSFGAEIVMGSRFSAPLYTRVQYFSHKIGNRLITLIFNVLNNTTFTDIYTCYLLYKRELINPDELISFGWEQQAEILGRAVRRAKVIYEVAISYHGRSFEEGKKIRGRHMIAIVMMIFRRAIAR
jgi:glycosyltransferase involved in cell wall biosynthesis